ncbi:MAG: hypothetical protein ACE37N_05830, partial [Pseudohongiellaceae bacterium]
ARMKSCSTASVEYALKVNQHHLMRKSAAVNRVMVGDHRTEQAGKHCHGRPTPDLQSRGVLRSQQALHTVAVAVTFSVLRAAPAQQFIAAARRPAVQPLPFQ